MNENEILITAALMTKEAAGDAESYLQNPILQYTAGGAAAGGLASLLRNMMGKPDPGMEGSALSRFLRSMALGGLAGAGVSGGAKLMGFDLPTASIKGAKPPKVQEGPGLTQAIGFGLPVGLMSLATALVLRKRATNKALSARMGGTAGTLTRLKSLTKTLSPNDAKAMSKLISRVEMAPERWSTVGGMPQAIKTVFNRGKINPKFVPGRGPVLSAKGWSMGISPQYGQVRSLDRANRIVTHLSKPEAIFGAVSGQSPQLMLLRKLIKRSRGGSGQTAGELAKDVLRRAPKIKPDGSMNWNKREPIDYDEFVNPLLRTHSVKGIPLLGSPSFLGGTIGGTAYNLALGKKGKE